MSTAMMEREETGVPESQIEALRERGLLGSALDFSWNGRMHICCGSPRAYYHREGCKACGDGLYDDLAEDAPIRGELSTPMLKAGAWRIEEEQAKTMYSLYMHGAGDGKPMSLEEIGRAYRRTRQAVYDIFHSRGWPLRSKRVQEAVVRYGIAFRPDAAGWLRGTMDGRRVYLHRMVWEKERGPVPDGFVLHAIDGNKLNVEVSNLELVPKKMMAIVFNPEKRRNDKKAWASRRSLAKRRKREARKGDLFDEEITEDEA